MERKNGLSSKVVRELQLLIYVVAPSDNFLKKAVVGELSKDPRLAEFRRG